MTDTKWYTKETAKTIEKLRGVVTEALNAPTVVVERSELLVLVEAYDDLRRDFSRVNSSLHEALSAFDDD